MVPSDSCRSRMLCSGIPAVVVLALAALSPRGVWGEEAVDFRREVQPLLQSRCLKCHGQQKQEGGLRFDTLAGALRAPDSGKPAIVRGQASRSELIRRVTSADDTDRMPPEGAALSAEQIEVLRRWIDAGASWPGDATLVPEQRNERVVTDEDRRHWSFQPLREVQPQDVENETWVRTPIDRFTLARQEAAGQQPAPRLATARLIRRVYFDVVGLPPEDVLMVPWETLVNQLLASRHYGERWGRHWLDVARYADSNGQEADKDRPNAYHYRDFVIRALNEDLPFRTFVQWQLAGDEIEPDNPQALAATGFLTAGPNTLLTVPMEDEKLRNRYNELDDMLSTIGTGLLGLTIGCARCHDHKYDAIPSRDYYRMLAAVHNGDRGDVPLASRAEVAEYQRQFAAWFKQRTVAEARLADWLEKNKQPIEQSLRDARIEALAISDAEKDLLRTHGDLPEAKALARQHALALRVSDQEIRRRLTKSQLRQWDELNGELQKIGSREPRAPTTAYAFRDFGSEPKATWLFQRGDFYDRDEPVELGFLSVLTNGKTAVEYLEQARRERPLAGSSYQRKALAEWITDVEHGAGALLARVIVNRVWQHYFGEGLVRTVSDFGVQGERPSDPALLEWLASDFVRGGWKLKRLHRLILTSATYQQVRTQRPPRRLEAEVLRDAMLTVSGKLNRQAYGPAFKPPIAQEAMVARNVKDPYPADIRDSPDTFRRSVYLFHKRVVPYPLLQAFDAPDAQQSCGLRERTTVAPQALALFNDPFVRDRSLDFADRLLGTSPASGDKLGPLVTQAYRLAFWRRPTAAELAASVTFVRSQQQRRQERDPSQDGDETRRQAVADFCQTLFTLNEFIYVD